ncbi:hypothetical protein EON77_03435 [bacterium]|nr:MAG: hypothetical protein EON77_03435 [bacterium]
MAKSKSKSKFGEQGALFAFRRMERYLGQRDVAKAERRGAKLGELWFRLDKRRVARAIDNVKLAFPELSEAERTERVRQACQHFGIVMADFMRTSFRTNEELIETVIFEGDDVKAYELACVPDKGIIATPPHYGNWERFGHWLLATGRMITVVARDANEGSVNEAVNTLRRKNGMGVVARGDSAREILRLLRRKEIVGLLPDQNSREAYVPFFGHLAGTVLGPAVLHIRTGAPILVCGCVRLGVGRYRIVCEPPLFAREGETPEALTARLNLSIEALIRRHPEQYLWMHDRWKSARRRGFIPEALGAPTPEQIAAIETERAERRARSLPEPDTDEDA